MKKILAVLLSLSSCLILSACENSKAKSDAKNNLSESNFTSDYQTNNSEVSGGACEGFPAVLFYNEEEYSQLSRYIYKSIQCDDYDKAIQDFLNEYYTNPDGKQEYNQDYLPVPYEYAPIAGAIEKSDVNKQLQINYAHIVGSQIYYHYSIGGKCVYVGFDKEENCGYPKDNASLVVKDKFTTPENLTESVPDMNGYCIIGNIVNGCTVNYGFDSSTKKASSVKIYVDGYYIGIGQEPPYGADLPDFLFNEEQLSDFIENLKYAINNEMVIYES